MIKNSLPEGFVKQHITGAGLSLRHCHLSQILSESPQVAWFELLVDNCFAAGGLEKAGLLEVAQRYPVVLHGVNLSIGSLDPLDFHYLSEIKRFKALTQAVFYSEHLSFCGVHGKRSPDLFPLPYTDAAVRHLIARIQQVQDFFQESIVLENISYYQHHDPLLEADFIAEVVKATDCQLLLDVNNLYVNSVNLNYDPDQFLETIPLNKVVQIHVAGHTQTPGLIVDTHSGSVSPEVLKLLKKVYQKQGIIPTNIEWDHKIPEFNVLLEEVEKIQRLQQESVVISSATVTHTQSYNLAQFTPPLSTQSFMVSSSDVAPLEDWQNTFLNLAQSENTAGFNPQFSVYRNNYRMGLKAWLMKIYPSARALFPKKMNAFVEGYICEVSFEYKQSKRLNGFDFFTERMKTPMPQFLHHFFRLYPYEIGFVNWFAAQKQTQEEAVTDQQLIIELLLFDLLRRYSLEAVDRTSFDYAGFGLLSEEKKAQLYLVAVADLCFLKSVFPLERLDFFIAQHRQPQEDFNADALAVHQPHFYSLTRPLDEVQCDTAETLDLEVFLQIQSLTPLAEFSDGLYSQLLLWFEKGWIADWSLQEQRTLETGARDEIQSSPA